MKVVYPDHALVFWIFKNMFIVDQILWFIILIRDAMGLQDQKCSALLFVKCYSIRKIVRARRRTVCLNANSVRAGMSQELTSVLA